MRGGNIRRVSLSGFVLLTSLWMAVAVAQPSPDANAEELLRQAQGLETSNFAEFSVVLQKLNSDAITLSPDQQMRVRYLNAFQLAYRGDSKASVRLLNDVIEHSSDPTLRLRAISTQINVLTLSARYEEAFTRLSQLLDLLDIGFERNGRSDNRGSRSRSKGGGRSRWNGSRCSGFGAGRSIDGFEFQIIPASIIAKDVLGIAVVDEGQCRRRGFDDC